jgi:soluble lytic murein transglycosylase-like protein
MSRTKAWAVIIGTAVWIAGLLAMASAAQADPCHVVDPYAQAAGVPVHIARAVIRHESGCNPRARNKSGATGLGQLMPATARGLGYRGSREGLLDVATNLRLSMRYLASALARGGSGCAGVALYERGLGARVGCTRYGRAVMVAASKGT